MTRMNRRSVTTRLSGRGIRRQCSVLWHQCRLLLLNLGRRVRWLRGRRHSCSMMLPRVTRSRGGSSVLWRQGSLLWLLSWCWTLVCGLGVGMRRGSWRSVARVLSAWMGVSRWHITPGCAACRRRSILSGTKSLLLLLLLYILWRRRGIMGSALVTKPRVRMVGRVRLLSVIMSRMNRRSVAIGLSGRGIRRRGSVLWRQRWLLLLDLRSRVCWLRGRRHGCSMMRMGM